MLVRTTKCYSSTMPYYYSSTTPYNQVLLQYYKVLPQVLFCTTKYYSVLHSTTPVLLCTTKYYSSTNSVLQSTTPVLLCTTKYYSSTTLCTKKYYSGTTPCTTKYARARRGAPTSPTSPNAVPATQRDSHE